MQDVTETVIHREAGVIRIIVDEQIIPLEKFKWNEEINYGGWITLADISAELGLEGGGVIYVWVETGLHGTIYQYGNYSPAMWQKHGTTRGFA